MASFSLSKPGPKEYLIVGGGALGLFLIYKWWKSRQAPAASSTNPAAASAEAPSTATGLSTGDLLAWIQDHTSSTSSTTTSTTTANPSGGDGSTGSGGAKEITLRKDRTLASLASEYGVTLTSLQSLNPDLTGHLKSGTKVRVPAAVAAARR